MPNTEPTKNQLRRRRDKRFTLTGRGAEAGATEGTGEMTIGLTAAAKLRIHTCCIYYCFNNFRAQGFS